MPLHVEHAASLVRYERCRDALCGVFEREREPGFEIGAALLAGTSGRSPTPAAAPHPAEQTTEQVVDVRVVAHEREALGATASAGTRAAAEARCHRPEAAHLVVLLALLRVAEHVVGGRDLLEPLLGLHVALVRVGVMLTSELAVRLRDLLRGRAFRDAERLVVVLLEPFPLRRHRSA